MRRPGEPTSTPRVPIHRSSAASPAPAHGGPRPSRVLVIITTLALVVGACSSGDSGEERGTDGEPNAGTEEEIVRGGDLTYALEAETSGGWCIPEATLAISGMMVAWTVYDFLFVPTEGGFVPFLAESMEPNGDYTVWTMTIRDAVKFHDGTDLDAQVVKSNIDAWRGEYPNRTSLLGSYVLSNIETVEIIDEMTLRITTKVPWPALPAYLYGGARNGIMAQAQLDDPDHCDTDLIGTGPFMMDEWVQNDHLTAVRNPNYWRDAPDGKPLPYLDSITFRPVPESQSRVNGMLSGQYDMIMASEASPTTTLQTESESGAVELVSTSVNTEVGFMMFNEAHPPFDDPVAREAVATALDRETYNEVVSLGLFAIASGPFAPGSPGYLPDAGFPEYDLDRAKELAATYERTHGEPLEFTYTHANDEDNTRSAQFIQQQLRKAGIEVNLQPAEQVALITTALGGQWDAMAFRNFPSGVPDGNYVWWHSGSPVNLGHIDDPEVDRLLDAGRSEFDEQAAASIYEDLNRRLNEQVHFAWLNWTLWTVAHSPDVAGVMGTELPSGDPPSEGLVTGHATSGIHFTR